MIPSLILAFALGFALCMAMAILTQLWIPKGQSHRQVEEPKAEAALRTPIVRPVDALIAKENEAKAQAANVETEGSEPSAQPAAELAPNQWSSELGKALPVLIEQLIAVNKQSEETILFIGKTVMELYGQLSTSQAEGEAKELLEEVQKSLLEIAVAGQSQDITRQRVEHVIEVLEILLDESTHIKEMRASRPPSCLITYMNHRFTMEEERDLIVDLLGHKKESSNEVEAEDVVLF